MARLVIPGQRPVARVRVVTPMSEADVVIWHRDDEVRLTLRSDGAILQAVLLGGDPTEPEGYSNRRHWSSHTIFQRVPERLASRPDVRSWFADQVARVYPTSRVIVEAPYGPTPEERAS